MMSWDKNDILFEDECVLVCRKHSGMAVQSAGIGQMDMESALRIYLQGGFVGIVQRLDQPVEGVLVFGKTPQVTAALNQQQQNGKMQKKYLVAFTWQKNSSGKLQGELKKESQEKEIVLEDYLYKDGRTNTSRVVERNHPQAKKSVLSYRILKKIYLADYIRDVKEEAIDNIDERKVSQQEIKKEIGFAEIMLQTGRHHQIRVQMSYHGMPLWADAKYKKELLKEEYHQPIGLCAYRLEFEHPKTKKKMKFQIEPEGEVFGALRS